MADLNLTISQTVQTYNITVIQDVVAYDLQPIIVLSGGGSVSGVSSIIAGTGISVDQATGDVTITNTVDGVDSVNGETGVVVLDGTDIPLLPGTTTPTVTSAIADVASPTTTLGDIIFNGGSGDVRYGIGTVGQVLTSDGSVPQWETPTTVGTVTSVGVSSSDSAIDITSSPITTSGTIDLALNVATTKTVLDYTEEEIDGTAVYDATLTGGEVIDLSTHTDAYYILTGNAVISVTNVPAVGLGFVRTWTIKSTTTQTLTLPVTWVVIGAYVADGSENYLTIRFSNFTTVGAKVICYITQA